MLAKSFFLPLAISILTIFGLQAQEQTFRSPNESLTLGIDARDGNLLLKLSSEGIIVNGVIENHTSTIHKVTSQQIDRSWSPVVGERKEVKDHFTEISIETEDAEGRIVNVNCSLYNEGFAFQIVYDENDFKDVVLEKEPVHWVFDGDHKTWVTAQSQGEYSTVTLSEIKGKVERPMLLESNQQMFYAIGEAGVINYPRSKFAVSAHSDNALTLIPDSDIVISKADFKSPWRYILVGKNPGIILEHNYILKSLNQENQIKDPSWIKPGKVIREVTLTTVGGKACVDFAVKHGLQYVEFDAGWYGNEYSKEADASTITVDPNRSKGPLDLHEVLEYAKDRGIGIILYVNNNAMLKQLDEILPLYRSWGVSGVKYGFVNNGTQEWNTWLHEAIRKAADNELMVDIHDDYRPTGFSRTYPNLLTQEGIRGDEESPSVEHSLYTIFIRGIAGAGDNTNCYLAPRVVEKLGGKGAQLAKAIMIYSPWQFLYWYDRPEGSPRKKGGAGAATSVLVSDIGFDFYAELPTTWDEIRVLEVKMGEYGTIARGKGNDWYVGALNAKEKRTVELDLGFLDSDVSYDGVIYFQNELAMSENKLLVEKVEVTSGSTFSKDLPANSGFALVLKKKN